MKKPWPLLAGSAILSNDKMGEYVLVSESEESLLDSEFDTDTVLNEWLCPS
jgi:hypothetical protein